MVRARRVVAERDRAGWAEEDGTGHSVGGDLPVGAVEGKLEVLGRDRVGKLDRRAEVGGLDERHGRPCDALALGSEGPQLVDQVVERAVVGADRHEQAIAAVLRLGEEIQRHPA
jgi:hypothetical protein